MSVALTCLRTNEFLARCEPVSFMSAMVQCSQLGLEPGGVTGEAYLVPFNNKKKNNVEVQLIPGYRGLIKLTRQSGLVSKLESRTVHENDKVFEVEYGLDGNIRHIPLFPGDRGALTCVYAVAKLKDGEYIFDVMGREEVEIIRQMSLEKNDSAHAPWNKFPQEMSRKTVVRRLVKYVPVSIEIPGYDKIVRTMELDRTADEGLAPQMIEEFMDIPQVEMPTEGQLEVAAAKDDDLKKMRDLVRQGMMDADGKLLAALYSKTGIKKPEDVERCQIQTLEEALTILA